MKRKKQMTDSLIILHLSLISGIGDGTVIRIIKKMKENGIALESLYKMSDAEIMHHCQISLPKAQSVRTGLAETSVLKRELQLLENNPVSYITVVDEQYPAYLKEIHCPPPILYFQGKPFSSEDRCIAVIGSRHANYYGLAAIEKLVPPLIESGWTIVSGGAIGADSKAHSITLECKGRTIAVLGSGILKPYPPSNKKLFEKIIMEGGTVCSPFPLMFDSFPANFPARNRIIAGLSKGCLVVQAAAKSGTHITAQFALEQGRDLFAVPGLIDDPLSAGCHSLIQQGAKLVHCAADILVELEPAMQMRLPFGEQNSETIGVREGPDALILRSCMSPCTIDELVQKTGIAAHDLYSQLFMLELEGKVRRELNGSWQRC